MWLSSIPPPVGAITDKEEIDDNIVGEYPVDVCKDIAGTFEIHNLRKKTIEQSNRSHDDGSISGPSCKKRKKTYRNESPRRELEES